jgi:hypothetical protein
MPQPLYPQERSSLHPLDGHQSRSGRGSEEKISSLFVYNGTPVVQRYSVLKNHTHMKFLNVSKYVQFPTGKIFRDEEYSVSKRDI